MYKYLIGNILVSSLYKATPYVLVLVAGKFFNDNDLSLFSTYINYLQLISAIGMYGLMYEYINIGDATKRLKKFSVIKKIILINFLLIIPISGILLLFILKPHSTIEIIEVFAGLTAAIPIALYGMKIIDLIELKKFMAAGIGSIFLITSGGLIIYSQINKEIYFIYILISLLFWLHYLLISKISNTNYTSEKLEKYKYKEYIKSSTPYFFSMLVTPLSVVAINFILLNYGGREAQAKFSFSYSIFALLVFLPNSLVQLIIIKLRNENTIKNIRRNIDKMGIYFLLISGISSLILIFSMNFIGFTARIDLDLVLYAASASIFGLSVPLTQWLISSGAKLLVLKLNYLWLIALLSLTFISCTFGTYNLGAIFLTTFTLMYILTRYLAFKREEI